MPPPAEEGAPPTHRGPAGDITRHLHAAASGDPVAEAALYAQVYDELHRLAHRTRAGRAGATLCTTALVHEAYVQLCPSRNSAGGAWSGRAHFFGAAARAMRNVLVDAARARAAARRGGGEALVTLGDDTAALALRSDQLLALDEALDRLGALDPRQLRIVEHRFFAGLTAAETAEAMGISLSTVEREWRGARAWLARELRAP